MYGSGSVQKCFLLGRVWVGSLPNLDRARPRFGRDRTNLGRTRANLGWLRGRILVGIGKLWDGIDKSGRFEPTLVRNRPWSGSANLGSGFGLGWGRDRPVCEPTLGRVRPSLGRVRAGLVRFCAAQSDLRWVRHDLAGLDQHRSGFACVGVARLCGQVLTELRLASADFGLVANACDGFGQPWVGFGLNSEFRPGLAWVRPYLSLPRLSWAGVV